MEENNTIKEQLLNWKIISKNRNLLFGIAIIWIMLLHTLNYPSIKNWEGFKEVRLLSTFYNFVKSGGAGVDIFLFLSGIGLYYSFSKCPNIRKFYVKRLKRVLIPYLIIGVGFWILRDIVYAQNPNGVWEDIFWITFYKDGKSTYWYILFILIMYLLYPLFYYLLESRYRNVNFIVLLCLAFGIIYQMYTQNYEIYTNIEKALSRVPIFIVGCYWGKIVKSEKPIHNFWIVYALIVPFLGGVFQLISKQGGLPWKVSNRIWYGMSAISISIFWAILFSITTIGIIGKLLNLAGTISLELYLIHIALKSLLKIWCPQYREWEIGQNYFMYFCVVILLSFALGIGFHIISEVINKFFLTKTSR